MFQTNNFTLLAASSYALYNARWQVKLFFKWIMQFFGSSGNAAKSNIGITVSVYVLVAIVKKHLNLDASLDTLLQIFPSLSSRRFAGSEHKAEQSNDCYQTNRLVF